MKSNPTVPIAKSELHQIDNALAAALNIISSDFTTIRSDLMKAQRLVRIVHDQAIEVQRETGDDVVEPTEKGPNVTLSREVTIRERQTLNVTAQEIGFIRWGIAVRAHALNEAGSASDFTREQVEEQIFFANEFEDRMQHELIEVQVDQFTEVDIDE
jgi:hypothetical protein